jgi:hypothetical protein
LINEENSEFVPIKKFNKKNKNVSRGAGHVLEHVFELKNFLKNLNVLNLKKNNNGNFEVL